MKKLMALSCLFSIGLFARDFNGFIDEHAKAALDRAERQFQECVTARGENNYSQCLEEKESLIACIMSEAQNRNAFVSKKSAATKKYKKAMERIDVQYQECLRARGSNRKQECMSERVRLIKNASKEQDESLFFDDSEYQRAINSQFREEGYYRRIQEENDRKLAERIAAEEAFRLANRSYYDFWKEFVWGRQN